jgi:hypothetical protein
MGGKRLKKWGKRTVTRAYARKQDLRRGEITPPDGSQVARSAAILVLSLPLMRSRKIKRVLQGDPFICVLLLINHHRKTPYP